MNKFFLLLVVFYLIYRLGRWLQRKPERRRVGSEETEVDEVEPFKVCARCGVLVPETEGVRVAGVFFCSAEHARQEHT